MPMAHYTAFFADAVNLLAKEDYSSTDLVLNALASHTGVPQHFLQKCFIGENQLPFQKIKSVISYRIALLKKKTKSYEVRKSDISQMLIGKELDGKDTFSLFDFLFRNSLSSNQQIVDTVVDIPLEKAGSMKGNLSLLKTGVSLEAQVVAVRKVLNCVIPLLVINENDEESYAALNLSLLYWIASPEKFFEMTQNDCTGWVFTALTNGPAASKDFLVEEVGDSKGIHPNLSKVEFVYDTFENALGSDLNNGRGEAITWKEDTSIALFTFPKNSSLPSVVTTDLHALSCVVKRILESY